MTTIDVAKIIEAAQHSLDLIGEGDWTPQDTTCAIVLTALEDVKVDHDELVLAVREYLDAQNADVGHYEEWLKVVAARERIIALVGSSEEAS